MREHLYVMEGWMDQRELWSEKLMTAEERLGEVYEIISELKRELKDAGMKKDAGALDEAAQRIGRYGQLFGELRLSWTTPDD